MELAVEFAVGFAVRFAVESAVEFAVAFYLSKSFLFVGISFFVCKTNVKFVFFFLWTYDSCGPPYVFNNELRDISITCFKNQIRTKWRNFQKYRKTASFWCLWYFPVWNYQQEDCPKNLNFCTEIPLTMMVKNILMSINLWYKATPSCIYSCIILASRFCMQNIQAKYREKFSSERRKR